MSGWRKDSDGRKGRTPASLEAWFKKRQRNNAESFMRTRTRGSPSWRGPMCHYAGYVCARPSKVINNPIANGAGHTFLKVQPRFRSQTSSTLRPIDTARSSYNRRTISLSVMSFASSIMRTMKSSWASRREPPRRPCLKGVNRPARALAIQAMAVEIPIPIGLPLNAPTCHSVTQPARGCADHH